MNFFQYKYSACIILVIAVLSGCKKYVDIPPPDDKITADAAFNDPQSISSAMTGLYMYAMGFGDLNNNIYESGRVDLFISLAADDAVNKGATTEQFFTNTFTLSDPALEHMWSTAYLVIGRVNSFIAGVEGSTVVSDDQKNHYLAQARLMRAFYYFNLSNLFGDVPLADNNDVNANAILPRAPRASVDSLIMEDLLFARDHLTADEGGIYAFNQNTANVMLTRMYGYQKDWANEEKAATAVMNSGRYSLTDVTQVFIRGNSEVIYAQPNAGTDFDGVAQLSFSENSYIGTMTPSLINRFDSGDLRLENWIQHVGTNYKYYKYTSTVSPPDQEYVFFRLAEVILLRAEARAEQNNMDGAVEDLNLIRERAGIADLPNTLSQSQAIDSMMSERRKEYFGEGITRWFDLSRWGLLQSTMSAAKPNTWTAKAALFPIMTTDLTLNPNLTQTPGY